MARIGLRRATRRARRRELARVPERLEVEQDHVGRVVVLPVLEQVVRRDVGLVADRDERREAEPARRPPVSSSASPSAPLCDEKRDRCPAASARGANVALSRTRPVTAMPRQFGPISRAPCARTSASSSSWRCCPSAPVSAKPAEITQSARVPCCERLVGRLEHVRCRHADDGEVDLVRDLLRRSCTRGRRRPACRVRLTGYAAPVKSPARMLRNSSPPIVPRRGEAPTTATVRGAKNGCSEAATATWSRTSTRSR